MSTSLAAGPAGSAVLVILVILGVHVALRPVGRARAQTPGQALEGTWRAGATRTDVAVASWGPDCGPRPQSSRSEGGGSVDIAQHDGQLTIGGSNHEVRTDRCWSRNPSLRRHSSTYLEGTWTTRCQTPENDPHAEAGTYIISTLGPDRLQYRDISKYNWKLKDSTCVASITTVQELSRDAQPGGEPASASSGGQKTSRTAAGAKPVCVPGAAHHIVLKPAQASVEIGGQLCYRARVVDARGCPVNGAPVNYAVAHAPELRARMEGSCFHASNSPAEAKGEFRVTASSQAMRAHATVTVQSVDLSGLIAMRLETGGVVGFDADEQLAPAQTQAKAHVSTGRAQPLPDPTEDLQQLMMLGTGGLAVAVLLGAWLRIRRKRPRRAPDTASRANTPAAGPAVRESAPDEAWICPACRHGYPAALVTCPKCTDGDTTLIPYSEFKHRAQQEPDWVTRRCRACGAELLPSANFCGHCGGRDLADATDDSSR